MSTLKIACLDYLWWGVAIGGRHYTGTLKYGDESIELRRKLTRRQAKELGETQEMLWMERLQRDTNKFDSIEDLTRAALKWCGANLSEHWLLLDGDEHNPSNALGACGPIEKNVEYINALADLWRKVPDYKREGKIMTMTYEVWRDLLTI